MWYGTIVVLAMIMSFLAGGSGNVVWFIVSAALVAVSAFLAWFETRNFSDSLQVLTFSLIWLGGTGGLSWPILRLPLAIAGIISGLILIVYGKIKKESEER